MFAASTRWRHADYLPSIPFERGNKIYSSLINCNFHSFEYPRVDQYSEHKIQQKTELKKLLLSPAVDIPVLFDLLDCDSMRRYF